MKNQRVFSIDYFKYYFKWLISVVCSVFPFFLRGWIACGLNGVVTLDLIKKCFTFEDVIWLALNPSIITLVDFIFIMYRWSRTSRIKEYNRVILWMIIVLILMFIMLLHYVLIIALPENSQFFFKTAGFFCVVSVIVCFYSQGIIGGNSK